MEVSFAGNKDKTAVRSLWDICFGDPPEYTDVFFDHLYKPESTVVARYDGQIIGSLQLFPHTFCMEGQEIPGMYIGGVDVSPQYRKRGVASRMIEFAEKHMCETGIAVSFLVPVTAAVYRSMGYSGLSWLSEISGPSSALSPFALTDTSLIPAAEPPVKAYTCFTKQFSLFLSRDEKRFTDEIFPLCDAECYVLDNDAGYILFSLKNGVLQGYECAWRNEEAFRRILGFILKQKEAESFCLRLPADGTARKLLCDTSVFENRRLHAMAKKLRPVNFTDSMENYINMVGWF